MKKLRKEEIAEDYCFVCKDGGDLLICDYGDCMKCYHPECEGKEESVLESKEHWTCRWHQCSVCHRPSKFQCYTCPIAVCGVDLYCIEFVQVKGNKGFCAHCLLLASLVEKNVDVVSEDGIKVDFKEEATYEQYFREYYEIVKEKEGLTAQITLSAMEAFQKGKQIKAEPDTEDVYDSEDDGLVSDYDDIGDEEQEVAPVRVKKKRKRLSGRMRKSDKSNALKFNGWGSESLIAFLNSVGESTTELLSLCDVDTIIRRYIHSNKLVTKKLVSCDEKLQSLFRKKSMKIHRISALLESHFAENAGQLEQEDIINATSSNEEDGSSMQQCQREKKKFHVAISSKTSSESVTTSKKKSCYAAVVPKNIKLIYLRRTLVEKLLKGEPETAKDKLLGSFVRIKSDPYDCMQKNSYQLVKVMGLKEELSSDQTIFLLKVSNRLKCIPGCDISEEDFTLEECDDLRQRIDAGMLKKITVVDLERKARMLHEDITKHGITRRLAILQNLIDRANEKGWRRELYEHLEAKDLLQTEAEQSRLLLEVPTVIADEIIYPPCTTVEGTEKSETELQQNINSKSSGSPNDTDSLGAKYLNVLEVNKLQPKEGLSKRLQDFNYPVGLPTLPIMNTPVVLGLRTMSKPAVGDTSSLSTWSNSPMMGLRYSEPDVEVTSSPSTMTNVFLNCLKLDFPTVFKSNNQSSFLQSLTTLSKAGDFSLRQIDAMENLIYQFPRLTSDYQFAEKTSSDFQRLMQLRSSLLEDVNQYMAERESVEAQEKKASESSINIQEEIRQLQLKLKAINSEKKALSSRKLALDSKVRDTNTKLAKFSFELDAWKIRERKAIKERETVHATWESFKKLFTNINETMGCELTSTEVMQQHFPNNWETVADSKMENSLMAAREALTKVKSEDRD